MLNITVSFNVLGNLIWLSLRPGNVGKFCTSFTNVVLFFLCFFFFLLFYSKNGSVSCLNALLGHY